LEAARVMYLVERTGHTVSHQFGFHEFRPDGRGRQQ
jgi:hypothetical protein